MPSPSPGATPYALGDAFAFSGTHTVSASFQYPSPSPYPSSTTTVKVAQDVIVTASANPYGPASASDFHTVETDSSALVSHTATTDAWMGLSGADVVEYGYTSADDSGDTLAADYTIPIVIDRRPETDGATWSNGAGVVYTERDADGTAATRTYAANGTYNEALSNSGTGISTSISENADGSGVYSSNGAFLNGAIGSFVFSAPAGNQVTVTATFVQPPSPAPTITPRVYTAPAWYGTSPVFFSQTAAVTAGAAYPAACNVPASYGTSGNKVVQTTKRLDTILGFIETQIQTNYTNAQYGPVCVMLSDVQNDYYDYQDDFATATASHLHFPGTPLSTTTITQTLTLQSGATIHAAGRRTESAATGALSQARVASAAAAFFLRVQRARDAREVRFAKYMSAPARSMERR